MKRSTVQLRLCRLEEQMRQIRAERDLRFLQVATLEEVDRMLELFGKLQKTAGKSGGKISPEETLELCALFETLDMRFQTVKGQK